MFFYLSLSFIAYFQHVECFHFLTYQHQYSIANSTRTLNLKPYTSKKMLFRNSTACWECFICNQESNWLHTAYTQIQSLHKRLVHKIPRSETLITYHPSGRGDGKGTGEMHFFDPVIVKLMPHTYQTFFLCLLLTFSYPSYVPCNDLLSLLTFPMQMLPTAHATPLILHILIDFG